MEVRGCQSVKELEEVVELCDAAFPKTEREYFERHILKDRTLSPADTRILVKDGKITSSAQVFPRRMYFQGGKVDIGGIGNVATLPLQRGKGFAGMVVKDSLDYIRKKNLSISFLTTTINTYYEKFDFTTVRRCIGQINLASVKENAHVRRFDRDRDLDKLMRLYAHYNKDSNGPIIRDTNYWLSQLDFCGEDKNLFYLYEDADEVLAFVRAKRKFDLIQVLEYGFADNRGEIMRILFEHLAFEANLAKLEMFVSDGEKARLSFADFSGFRVDTEMMVNFIDTDLAPEIKQVLLSENGLTFWLTDFF